MIGEFVLYDSKGNPIKPDKARLNQEVASPGLFGVRSIWRDSTALGLNPVVLARLLQAAGHGDTAAYLTLAEEMEERDLHYASVIGTRKRAVTRLPLNVEAAADDSQSVKIADSVRTLVKQTSFRGLMADALDALGKGFSVTEIIWDTTKTPWMPKRYAWRDPRFFIFDQADMQQIRLRDEADPINGVGLDPYKFVVHVPKLKSGIPIRGGLAYLACWAWLFKNFTVRDWMAFSEVFGMPIRLGKYGPGATPDEIDVLKMAVANIGVDAAAVIPQSMMVEIVAQNAKGGESPFRMAADWFDSQISKGVLGQTATTQGTPGKLGGDDAQKEVRQDIKDSDAEQLEETLNRDLVVPFVILNFGPQKEYPRLTLREPDAEDLGALVSALEKLVPLGLKVEQSVVRDKLGLPDPAEGAELLAVQRPEPVAPEENGLEDQQPDNKETAPVDKNDQSGQKAVNAETPGLNPGAGFTPEQQALENLADSVIRQAAEAMKSNEDKLLAVIMESSSYEEMIRKVLELYPDLGMDAVTGGLERAMLNAGLFGRWAVANEM